MNNAGQFKIADIGKIFWYCFTPKKIIIQAAGLVCAGIIKILFSTLSSKIEIIDQCTQRLGDFLASVPLIFAMAATTLMFIEELVHKKNISISYALALTREKLYSIGLALIYIFGTVLVILLLTLILNLIVKIPYLGELIWPFLYGPLFLISAVWMAVPIGGILIIHLLPGILFIEPEEVNVLKKLYQVLKATFPGWIPFFAVSTAAGFVILAVHYGVCIIQIYYSILIIGEKFFNLLVAIPFYPGYLLTPWLEQYLPFDYVTHSSFTYSVGAFLWSMAMYIGLTLVIAVILNLWNSVGAYYLIQSQSSGNRK